MELILFCLLSIYSHGGILRYRPISTDSHCNVSSRKQSLCPQLYKNQKLIAITKTLPLFYSNSVEQVLPLSRFSSKYPNTITKQHVVCPSRLGELGNNMFQFASAFGIAKLNNLYVVLDSKDVLLKKFKIKLYLRKNKINCQTAKTIVERWSCVFDEKLIHLDNRTDYKIGLWLQSWKYFKNAEEELRKQFTFKDNILISAKKILKDALQRHNLDRSNVTLVGIHVRRGDMVNDSFGFQVASKDYLERAMGYYYSKFRNVMYIVCSNGMQWCRDNIKKDYRVEFVKRNNPAVDMAILTLSDHVIQTVGSYSWWAAWLSGGTSIYYKWPAKEGSALRKLYGEDYSDYFYPSWIGM